EDSEDGAGRRQGRSAFGPAGAPLQELEARDAVPVERDDLAVEHDAAAGEPIDRPSDLGKLTRDVSLVSRVQTCAAGSTVRQRTDPVVLLFEPPARTMEGLRDERRQHRSDRLLHRRRAGAVSRFAAPRRRTGRLAGTRFAAFVGSPLAALATSPP